MNISPVRKSPVSLLLLGYEVCCAYLFPPSRVNSSHTTEGLPANKEHPPYRSPSWHVQMPPNLPLASMIHVNNANISSIFEN